MKLLFAFLSMAYTFSAFSSTHECVGIAADGESFVVRYAPKNINVTVLRGGYPVDGGRDYSVYLWDHNGQGLKVQGSHRGSIILPSMTFVRADIRAGDQKSRFSIGKGKINGVEWSKPLKMTCP